MDSDDIKQEISESFKWVKSYTVLEPTGGGHSLIVCNKQQLDGESIIDRRGPLYLRANSFDEFIVSTCTIGGVYIELDTLVSLTISTLLLGNLHF